MSDTETPTYFVAKQPLKVGGVNAFGAGDDVPASTVKAQGWEDYVEPAETKAGKPTAAAARIKAAAAEPSDFPAQPGV